MEASHRAIEPSVAAPTPQPIVGRVLVHCAICEQDRALVHSHDAADRLLAEHLADCPGPSATGEP